MAEFSMPPGLAGRTIPQVLMEKCRLLGERTAMRYKEFGLWHDISWREYGEKVRHTALGFAALGFEPGDTVAVIGDNCPEWLFTDLGAMAAGGVSVGIYTTNSAEECAYILEHSGARIYVVENEEQLDKALEVRDDCPNLAKIVVIDLEGLRNFTDPMVLSFAELLELGEKHDRENPGLFEERLACRTPEDLALLIYTSGTTGPPKGAMLSHLNVLWTAPALSAAVPVNENDELISFLPLSHIAERMFSVYLPLEFHYTINFIENTDTVFDNIIEISPTVFFAVPRIWEKFSSAIFIKMKDATWVKRNVFGLALKVGQARAAARFSPGGVGLGLRVLFTLVHVLVFAKLKERLGLERVRVAISGAAPISPKVLTFYHALGIPLRQVYGQTEDTGPTTIHQGDLIEPENVGPAVPGVEVAIAPDGEILVRGPNVFLGYFKNPAATAETLEGGWLHSGDVGELDERGYLTITDRKKDLIITSGGKNIAPQNLENQLKFSPYINDAVVIGDQRKFLSALIFIDEDNVVKYATDHKIPYTTYASLTKAPAVVQLIGEEVERVNATVARVEQIKRFTILPKKLVQEDGEVTPTMKIKRKYINETYRELIDLMYR
ncbi:MAG: AMP-binding protein [Deltaproteobacteria bacterium]|nr:AMP-binding protein [Deltaproteobacteria bacterium]